MRVMEPIRQAFGNLWSAKLRSFLAVLGILVGTASVVTLITGGEAATEKALQELKALGTHLMDVRLGQVEASKEGHIIHQLTVEEALLLRDAIPQIESVAPFATLYAQTIFEGHAVDSVIMGGSEQLMQPLKIKLARGHFVSLLETSERYCVIGAELAKEFQRQTIGDPLGRQIRLGNQIYTIIGILAEWPSNAFFYADINRSVIIPLRGVQLIDPQANISSLLLTLNEKANIDAVKASVTAYFRQHTPELKAFIRSPKEVIQRMESQQQTFTLLLALIGSISLLVGGIGVMNVMLVSVTERKREIGLRKAIGATRGDIQLLFLMESLVLSLFGGALGVGLGISLSLIIGYFAAWPTSIYLLPVVVGFIVSAATGVFFGFYPAYRAAKLNPIEALRYD